MGTLMRRSAAEKQEIIRLVEHSALPITRTLEELEVPRSSFYRWYQQLQQTGPDGLTTRPQRRRQFPLALPLRGSAGTSVEPDPG